MDNSEKRFSRFGKKSGPFPKKQTTTPTGAVLEKNWAVLKHVWGRFCKTVGRRHPSTLARRYCRKSTGRPGVPHHFPVKRARDMPQAPGVLPHDGQGAYLAQAVRTGQQAGLVMPQQHQLRLVGQHVLHGAAAAGDLMEVQHVVGGRGHQHLQMGQVVCRENEGGGGGETYLPPPHVHPPPRDDGSPPDPGGTITK